MKTYYASDYLGRLAAYLIAVSYPFCFDGFAIEFTATEIFYNKLISEDKKLAEIKWKIL